MTYYLSPAQPLQKRYVTAHMTPDTTLPPHSFQSMGPVGCRTSRTLILSGTGCGSTHDHGYSTHYL